MTNPYRAQRRWSDKFIPAIKRIVGPYLLEESTFEVDTKQAADLVIVRAKNLAIAARVRRSEFYSRFPNDITIRSENNGHKTELQKIVEGFGDWFFYGFARSDRDEETEIDHWRIIDLDVLRACWIREKEKSKPKTMANSDGTKFVSICVPKFPPELVIASSNNSFVDDFLF